MNILSLTLFVLLLVQELSLFVASGGSPGGQFSVISSSYLKNSRDRNYNNNREGFNSINQQRSYGSHNYYNKQYVPRSSQLALSPSNLTTYAYCPSECICRGLSIDCSRRNLARVMGTIPANVIRADLQENQLSKILSTDFSYLTSLKVLHLQNNHIESIEDLAFANLINLERLLLNNNQITYLPGTLFLNLKTLKRLDLSHNNLKSITNQQFVSLSELNNLQLENNQIKCIEKGSFDRTNKLSILRLHNNPLRCNCKLSWLSQWLLNNPNLGLDTKCQLPNRNEIKVYKMDQSHCQHVSESNLKCEIETSCPAKCTCDMGIIDCKEQSLTKIPEHIDQSTVELDLKKNELVEVPHEAFIDLKGLRLLDLSNNKIERIFPDSFKGLVALNTLILFRNNLKYLPPMSFVDSSNLQFLLLNANNLKCFTHNTFEGLSKLTLLSLYDNQLNLLPEGLFDPLTSIQTM